MSVSRDEQGPAPAALEDDPKLEEILDGSSLGEFVASFHQLFMIPMKVFGESGQLLADVGSQPAIYQYVSRFPGGRRCVQEVASAVKRLDPGSREISHRCFAGLSYRVSALLYEGRRLGRLVLGPFSSSAAPTPPASLLTADAQIDGDAAVRLLQELPRVHDRTVDRIVGHFRKMLDLVVFGGHKALLTSTLHLASVRQGYRELENKNQQLQEAFDKLRELDRLKSNFLATVSHELRTPLTSIIGYSEMLGEGISGELNQEQGEFVGIIRQKGEQLLELISGLLDLSKLESGTLSLKRDQVDVPALVTDVLATLTPSARTRNVTLSAQSEPGLQVLGDAIRLRQVLLNLGENALKFTPEGGRVSIEATITTMVPASGDEGSAPVILRASVPAARISVADSGPGIPDSEKTRVFDAFYQVDSSSTRHVGGTGLGLSIVKRLVDGHGGSVTVEDNMPRGTRMVVNLPLYHATWS